MIKRRTRLAACIERHIVLPDVVAEPGSIRLAPYMRGICLISNARTIRCRCWI